MCRFLVLASSEPYPPRDLAAQFARMCHDSRCLDGDWQGDGWGAAWQTQDGTWQRHRSIAPIWTELDALQTLPRTRHLALHARAASFPQHKGELVFSQPYVTEPYVFVFNGLIRGVRLPRKVPGTIGAEKIWHLVHERLAKGESPQHALTATYALLNRRSREIQACNMAVSNGRDYAFHNGNPSGQAYYHLHEAHHGPLRMVCSEPFGAWNWRVPPSHGMQDATSPSATQGRESEFASC